MTNYLDKEGLKKFWDITKGKYSALGHTHDYKELLNKPSGGGRNWFCFKRIRFDYYPYISEDRTINGYIINRSTGLNRIFNISADMPTGYWTVSFWIKAEKACQVFVNLCDKLAITDYNESSYTSVTTEYQYHRYTFYTNVYAYNGLLDIENSEGIKIWVKDIKIETGVIATDWSPAPEDVVDAIPTKLSQLTDDVVSGKYLPLSGGTLTGALTVNMNDITVQRSDLEEIAVVSKNANGDIRLNVHYNRGVWDATGGNWLIAANYQNNHTMLMQGNVGINTKEPDSRLHVNGSFHATGASQLDSTLTVKGATNVQGLTVDGIATVQKNITTASDRMVFDVGGKTGSGNETGFNFNGLVYSSGNFKGRGLVITDGSTPILAALSTNGVHLYQDTALSKTLKVTGNVGIGTDADAAYKLKVNGKAYISGNATVNGDLQVNGAINNGDFYTDMDGWAYTTQLNINNGGDLVMYDSNGDEHILNLKKAIELGVFS